MDILILVSTVITLIAALVGVIAGVVTIIDYYQKRKNKPKTDSTKKLLDSTSDSKILSMVPARFISNLPPRSTFIGRAFEKSKLLDAILQNRIIVIEGVGGIGKTALALEIGHEIIGLVRNSDEDGEWYHLLDATIWISAKGVELSLDKVLASIARTLDYPFILQLNTQEKMHEIFKLLQTKKVLLFFDNIEVVDDGKIFKFIEEIPEPSKILLTTRVQHPWKSPYILPLGSLSISEGVELIRREGHNLGLDIIKSVSEDLLVDLINVTGGSPLALRWSVGQLKQRGESYESILSMLRNAEGDIFENIFLGAWSNLDVSSKVVLQAMPFFASSVSRDALFAATGLPREEFNKSLGKLIELWLIESNRELLEKKQRFSFHALTRAFVFKETNLFNLEHIWWRISEYYISFCNERKYLQLGLVGYNEIESEIENILKIIDWLKGQCIKDFKSFEACDKLIQFNEAINVFFWSRGYWSNRAELCDIAMNASVFLNDWTGAGRQAYYIGIVRVWQGNVPEAKRWSQISSDFMGKSGKELDLALVTRLTGLVNMISGNYEDAANNHIKVLEILTKPENIENKAIGIFADWVTPGVKGYKVGIVSLLQELGIIANKKGDYPEAVKWLKESIDLAESINDGEGLSVCYSHLGNSYLGLRDLSLAKVSFEKGLNLAHQFQRKSTLGRCNQGLANVYYLESDISSFAPYARNAIDYFDRLGMEQEKNQVESLLRNQ